MRDFSDLPLVEELATVRLNNLAVLPEDSGVYLVADDANRVYYIGQYKNLQESLLSSDLSDFRELNASKVCYFLCDETELGDIEADYITFYNPPLNAGVPLEKIEKSSVSYTLTPEQQIERYLEICSLIKELEAEKNALKENIVTFAANYKQERGEYLHYQGVTIVASQRKTWEYSDTVKELETKVKQLKKQEQKNGLAKVAKVSVFPMVRGELKF